MAKGKKQAPQISSQKQDYISEGSKGYRQAFKDLKNDPIPTGIP